MEVPYKVMLNAYNIWPHMKRVAPIFNIDAKSDLLVAVKCLETGIYGAYQNVLINANGFKKTDNNDDKVYFSFSF
jgi:glutamate formiminotransferase/formiminotetrahydrofolate cyclodeaminase